MKLYHEFCLKAELRRKRPLEIRYKRMNSLRKLENEEDEVFER
jgi:hypothetical protein